MNSKIIIVAIIGIAVLAGIMFYMRGGGTPIGGTATTTVDRPLKTYADERYKIAFNFPDNYEVQEHDSTEGTKRHTIVIGDKAALANVPENSEGPPVITIDIFDNPRNTTAEQWVKSENLSNYQLAPDKTLTPIKVADKDAIAYGWDGLYRSNSIVFSHSQRIYMMSVGYNSPDDQLLKDFAKVVASVQLDP